MTRVLTVCYEYPPVGGGTGVACERLVHELTRDGRTRIDVVTSGSDPTVTIERPSPSLEILRLPVGKREPHFWRATELARWTWSALSTCRRLMSGRSYDLCHCWAGWPSGLAGYRMRDRMPYVIGLRGSDVPGYNKRLRVLDPLLFRRVSRAVWTNASAVVAVSGSLAGLARETCTDIRIDVIRNGVDAGAFTPAPTPPAPFTVLYVGRLVERKGVGLLMRAFREFAGRDKDARLIVVGDGPERTALAELAAACPARIELRGRLEREALPAAYREASVFASPALEEAMPNAVIEAMACGLPVITTPTGARELIDDNGILVERGSVAGIREALERYRSDPALQERHGRRSRQLAESMSWSAVAMRYQQLYEEVLRASRTRDARVGARGSINAT